MSKIRFGTRHAFTANCSGWGLRSRIERRQVHGQTTGPSSEGWRTFLRNHAPDIAAMDLFVVPTIGFDLLYAFVIVRLDRRDLVWTNVTANPTAAHRAQPSTTFALRSVPR